MSLFSAFGKASLNFVTKLGEIVAPIDDDDEIKDAKRRDEGVDSKLMDNASLINESGDTISSEMQQLPSISSANLTGVFNDVIAGRALASHIVPIKSKSADDLPASVQVKPSSSSCMVEVELDESFESTPFKSPPSEKISFGTTSLQPIQNRSQSNDSHEMEDLFLGGQPAHIEKQQALILPSSQKQPTPLPSSIPLNCENQSAMIASSSHKERDFSGITALNDVEIFGGDNGAADIPHASEPKQANFAPFASLVNSFPVYKPHGDVESSICRNDNGAVSLGPEHRHQHGTSDQVQSFLGIEEKRAREKYDDAKFDTAHRIIKPVAQSSSGSSSSSSSSHKDSLAFQQSSCDVDDGHVHESSDQCSSSSNSDSGTLSTSAAGHVVFHQNQREKDGEDRGYRTTFGKSSKSVLFIDGPPGTSNHDLNAQLGTQHCLI